MDFHIAGRNEGFFSHVASATWELKVVILLKSLVTMHATKGFFTIVNSFVYFHIDGRNDGFLSCMASSMAIPFGQWE